MADIRMADTSILRTRDVSHVDTTFRPGLYRIHVRRAPSGAGFQQRFEYVVKGAPDAVTAFVTAQTAAGAVLSEQRTVGAVAYALLLTPVPVAVPATLTPVTFRDLRAGDRRAICRGCGSGSIVASLASDVPARNGASVWIELPGRGRPTAQASTDARSRPRGWAMWSRSSVGCGRAHRRSPRRCRARPASGMRPTSRWRASSGHERQSQDSSWTMRVVGAGPHAGRGGEALRRWKSLVLRAAGAR